MREFRIAVFAGDGIGREVMERLVAAGALDEGHDPGGGAGEHNRPLGIGWVRVIGGALNGHGAPSPGRVPVNGVFVK